jgi:hypothetical protein
MLSVGEKVAVRRDAMVSVACKPRNEMRVM